MVEPSFDPNKWTLTIFEGDCPPAAAQRHDATPLLQSPSATEQFNDHTLRPLDIVFPLASITGQAGPSMWALLRPIAGSHTVLVVEDDAVNLEYFMELMTQVGFTPTGAADRAEATEAVRGQAFDLALIDIRLPDANGYELCRTLRSQPGFDRTAVLLMSADPGLADEDRVQAVGAQGFIVNPISPKQLASLVRRTISHADERDPRPVSSSVNQQLVGPTCRLAFFGTPTLWIGDRAIPIPSGRSADLLATLATACPAAMSTERLTRFVWSKDSAVSTNAVYTAVSRLRAMLAEHGMVEMLTTADDGYTLNVRPEQIDLAQFERRAADILRDPHATTAADIREVLHGSTSRPFEQTHNTLLSRWSTRVTETRAQLFEVLANAELVAGNHGAAIVVCEELLADEPWRENVWSMKVVALYRAGRSNDALQTFSRARDLLLEELGLNPGPSLAGLEMMVLSHDPSLLNDEWLRSIALGQAPSTSR